MKIYAVIPARSGSKGLPNKNIRRIDGRPLIDFSIQFAKKLPSVSRVFCSTDSEEYADIARESGAEVPFLRSAEAALDNAMEQDILQDLREKFRLSNIAEPDLLVWLRPTFIFRSVEDVEACVQMLVKDSAVSSSRTVIGAENRLYSISKGVLSPDFNDFGKSMMRRQDMVSSYKVFSTDVIRFKGNKFDDAFLGSSVGAVATDSVCGLDIDDIFDFTLVKLLVENAKELVNEYL